ncbi:MAG: SpoIIE family protein phosphatase [Janthinobacterium lividum]
MPMQLQPAALAATFSVLIIDDSEDDRFTLRRLLSQSGRVFEIREAATGAQGLALCRERLPDCLLLDYGLGDTDGLSLLAELNAGRDPDNDPICPAVILTGAATVATIAVRALKGGAQDYLVKESLIPAGIILAIENAVEKVRLRRELRATGARFRLSLENMLDCFGIYTAVRDPLSGAIQDFRCEYVNEAACRSNHLPREEQVGRLLVTGALPTHRAGGLFNDYVQVVETGRPLEKTDVIYGDAIYGSVESLERAFDIRVWKMSDGFAAAWRDVTAQKRAEEQLREAKERLTFAVDASESGVFELDCITGTHHYASRTFSLLGLPTPTESVHTEFFPVESEDFWEQVHVADRERVEEALRNACDPDSAAPGVYQAEYRVSLTGGAERWIASTGRVTFDATGRHPVRLAGLLQNVTARKHEQQTVQHLAAVVENSVDFIAGATPDGRGLFINAAGQRLVGLPDQDAVHDTCVADYFFPEDAPAVLASIQQALTTGQASSETRFRHFVTGEAIDVFWNLMALRDTTTGQPYALAMISRDIREQKRLEAVHAELDAKRERVAEAVQRSLLLAPLPDAYPGLIVQPFYQSAWDEALVGGDFFDVFPLSEDEVVLVVGDAMGKGVEAALYTAEVKFTLRAFLREHLGDLRTALRLLNGFVAGSSLNPANPDSYIALVIVLVNTRTGEVSCCCAGAEPPLILRAGTGEVVEASVFGPLLGASEAAEYTVTRDVLGTGDLIALTTDGITESRRPPAPDSEGRMRHGEYFGLDGLARALTEETADTDRTLAEAEEAVVGQALTWAGGRQHDDICLLLARRIA